jgi:hypothetical protein
MNSKELLTYVEGLVKQNVKYRVEPPYSIEEGHNCFSWVMSLRNYVTNETNDLDYNHIRPLREQYNKVYDTPQFLDMPLFYLDTLGQRHVGLMLNSTLFTQCAYTTNGISIANINRPPWSTLVKGLYRHK